MNTPSALRIFLYAAICFYFNSAAVHAQGVHDWAGAAIGLNVSGPSQSTEFTTDDLLRLRDLGGLSISPDGTRIAFQVQQADPASNSYVLRWFIASIDGRHAPRALDFDGGQPIASVHFGWPEADIQPAYAKWSPDGKWIAVRRLEKHRISLWLLSSDSKGNIEVATGETQVAEFGWTASGILLYRTGLRYDNYRERVEEEAKHGYYWDSRVVQYTGKLEPGEPNCFSSKIDPSCDNATLAFEFARGLRSATREEVSTISEFLDSRDDSRRADGAIARAVAVDPRFAKAQAPIKRISMIFSGTTSCSARVCEGGKIRGLGWTADGRAIWFLKADGGLGRSDGAPGNLTGLYLWRPRTNEVKTLRQVDGLISDCHTAASGIVCFESIGKVPGRIIAIGLDGRARTIADPNPTMEAKELPRVAKIIVKDVNNDPYYAEVVYPRNYSAGRRYPLVVTQYSSKGFLRGQVGNEYPIYPLANRGFVVLSVNWGRPPSKQATSTVEEMNAAYSKDGREIVRGVIDRAVDRLVAEGLVDEKRVALTGLSSGAEVTNYILQRSNRFRASITSSAAQDVTFFALAPEGAIRDRIMAQFGTKSLMPKADNPIFEMSWSNRPEALKTPLLINVGEYEALVGFEGTQAILHSGGPLEMRIFPGEGHVVYFPQTLAGIYDNNIEWLEFWLMDKERNDSGLREQYDRWRKMKRNRGL